MCEINETYLFSMLNWLVFLIIILGNIFVITLLGMIWYFKSKIKSKVLPLVANHLQKQEKHSMDISSPQLVSTRALTNDQHKPRQQTPVPGKKNLVTHYNVQADKVVIRSVTLEIFSSA